MRILGIGRNSSRYTIAWNTLVQLIGKLVNAGITFLITLLIARTYGVNTFGDFTKITTYVAFYYLFADFGLNAVYLQKEHLSTLVGTNEKEKNLWGSLFGLRVVGGIFLIFLSLAVLSFLPQGTNQGYTGIVRLGIILFSPTILFQSILTSSNAIFQKFLRYDLSSLATIVGSVVSLGLVWINTNIIAPQVGSVFLSLSLLAGAGITGVASLVFATRLEKSISFSFRIPDMKTLFVSAIPLGLTLIFNQVYFRIDSVVLTLTRSTTEVGLYGFAYKIFEVILVAPTFFMNAMYPMMLNEITSDKQKAISNTFKTTLVKSFIALLLASLLSLIAIWFTSPLLTYIRPEFGGSVQALRILSLGLPFFFLSSLTMWSLIALKKQHILAVIYGSSMLITAVMDIVLIPNFGYLSAAWITVCSELLVLIVSTLILLRYTRTS